MRCVCHNDVQTGERLVTVNYAVDWGTQDERETTVTKSQGFCSFRCVANWASDLADRWDNVTVASPEESHEGRPVTVDDETDHVLRGAA